MVRGREMEAHLAELAQYANTFFDPSSIITNKPKSHVSFREELE